LEPEIMPKWIVLPALLIASLPCTACFEPRCWETATCPPIPGADAGPADAAASAVLPLLPSNSTPADAGASNSAPDTGSASASATEAATPYASSEASVEPDANSTPGSTDSGGSPGIADSSLPNKDSGTSGAGGGPDSAVTPEPVTEKPTIQRFLSSESSLPGGGGTVNLSWQVTGAETLTIEPGIGDVTNAEGSLTTVTVTENTTFTLTAKNAAGEVTATRKVDVSNQGILDWVDQFGDEDVDDFGLGVVALPNDQIAISGYTYGALDSSGAPNSGWNDLFVATYTQTGARVRVVQLGSSKSDWLRALATDGNGGLILLGATGGDVAGGNRGDDDGFIVELSSASTPLWKTQLGTPEEDSVNALAVDGQNRLFLAGETCGGLVQGHSANCFDGYVAKYSATRELLGLVQIGTPDHTETFHSVAIRSDGNPILLGETNGVFNLTTLTAELEPITVHELLDFDVVSMRMALQADSNVILFGTTAASLDDDGHINAGKLDSYVAEYDLETGEFSWIRQFGSAGDEETRGVAFAENGDIYLVGGSSGNLDPNRTNPNDKKDAYLAHYSKDGAPVRFRQFGTPADDSAYGVAADAHGNVYVTGYTFGALGVPSVSGTDADAFLAHFR
jgi:Beta-propeller repeat